MRIEIVNSKTPVPMAVVAPIPKGAPPQCEWIDDPPIPPDEITTLVDEDDVVRRVFVHIRQYNEMVAYAHDMFTLMTEVKACLATLQEERQ